MNGGLGSVWETILGVFFFGLSKSVGVLKTNQEWKTQDLEANQDLEINQDLETQDLETNHDLEILEFGLIWTLGLVQGLETLKLIRFGSLELFKFQKSWGWSDLET